MNPFAPSKNVGAMLLQHIPNPFANFVGNPQSVMAGSTPQGIAAKTHYSYHHQHHSNKNKNKNHHAKRKQTDNSTKQQQEMRQKQQRTGKQKSNINLKQGMAETLEEIKSMREEMAELRRELAHLRRTLGGPPENPRDAATTPRQPPTDRGSTAVAAETGPGPPAESQRERWRELRAVGAQVEEWAEQLLFHTNDGGESDTTDDDDGSATKSDNNNKKDDWKAVPCNKMLQKKFNPDLRTTIFVKWMKDSRKYCNGAAAGGKNGDGSENCDVDDGAEDDPQEWPCIRMYSTIDAPIEHVSLYLANRENFPHYNHLIAEHRDLRKLTQTSKICWGRSPQILFLQPRDFVTYCQYRWRNDGTQVLVNQALDRYVVDDDDDDHGDDNGHHDSKHDKRKDRPPQTIQANAYALRGAAFVGPHPDDPQGKTAIAMICHASPGPDVPAWACRTAINSLAPIEPYRLFYQINAGVLQNFDNLDRQARALKQRESQIATAVSSSSSSNEDSAEYDGNGKTTKARGNHRTHYPAGLASLGYACFWPNGAAEPDGEK